MQFSHTNDNRLNPVVHFKIRTNALTVSGQPPAFDSVEEFCNRINRLRSKSDQELSKMGLDRSDIGAHVLQKLLN